MESCFSFQDVMWRICSLYISRFQLYLQKVLYIFTKAYVQLQIYSLYNSLELFNHLLSARKADSNNIQGQSAFPILFGSTCFPTTLCSRNLSNQIPKKQNFCSNKATIPDRLYSDFTREFQPYLASLVLECVFSHINSEVVLPHYCMVSCSCVLGHNWNIDLSM